MELVSTSTQTPIEIALGIDKDGMTTARKLYDFLGLAPQHFARWCKKRISVKMILRQKMKIIYDSPQVGRRRQVEW